MDFLNKLGFDLEQIKVMENDTPEELYQMVVNQKKLVSANISYLMELNINNYQDIFLKFYDMFLLDHSTFREIFDKYDEKSLAEKLRNNIDIFEFL